MSKINPNVNAMTKSVTAVGTPSFNCGDSVAIGLAGQPLDVVQKIAEYMAIDHTKYDHLNPGHKRMILGNMMRKQVRQMTKAADAAKARGEAAMDGDTWFTTVVGNFRVEPQSEAA